MRIVFLSLLLTLAAAMTWQAVQIQGPAAAYPIVVTSAAVIVLTCYLGVQVTRRGADLSVANPFTMPERGVWRLVGFIAVWIGYVAVLPSLGFILATWAALLLSLVLVRSRAVLKATFYTATFTLVLAILLKVVLYVPVPQGWIDEALEVLLYRAI